MRIILLGAPGVGKGTQGLRLAGCYHVPKLSTGEVLRLEVDTGSELGLRIENSMKGGGLVPDAIVEEIVAAKLSSSECANGFILDGFPRTLHQAEALTKMLEKLPEAPIFVVNIKVGIDKLMGRLANRVMCRDCASAFTKDVVQCLKCGSLDLYRREDDKEEAVLNRLLVYEASTKPLLEYYAAHAGWIEVDGEQSIEAVSIEMIKAINSKFLKTVKNT